ncbi:MAG: hypothetical protein QXW35_04360 [Candidatus Aenigmatarchaeota archaeon]
MDTKDKILLGAGFAGLDWGDPEILSKSNVEKLEIIESIQDKELKQFFLLCFYGKEKFINHYLGISRLSVKELNELFLNSTLDPKMVLRFSRVLIEYDKAHQNEQSIDEEFLNSLKEIQNLLDKGSLEE